MTNHLIRVMKTTLRERKEKISLIEAYLRQYFRPFKTEVEHSWLPCSAIEFRVYFPPKALGFCVPFDDLDSIPANYLKQFVLSRLAGYGDPNQTTQNY